MTSKFPASLAVPTAAGLLFFGAGVQTAHADLYGGDIPLLTTLVVNTSEQLQQAYSTIETLKKTYDDAKRVAGYADEAYKAYQQFSKYTAQRFSADALTSLDNAFPDIGYFRREASRTGPWAEGTGELQSLVSYCFTGLARGADSGCIELQQALTLHQARTAIQKTFGTVPAVAGSLEVIAVDHEASVAMASSASQFERSKLSRNEADGLLDACKGSDDVSACQAAGSTAQIRQLRVSADMSDQLAEANRLKAVELSQQNARRKRELLEAAERRQVVLESGAALGQPPAHLKTEGVDILGKGL